MIAVNKFTLSNKDCVLIDGLNITFKAGEFWAILGKNGTGKSTLLHTLAGLLPYDTGSITLNEYELSNISPLQRAQNIALLPQLMETGLDCTVEQSIAYGRYPWHKFKLNPETEKKVLENAINSMQLNAIRHKSIQHISGGELRKVEIATLLAQNSDILLLDEPLNHLDLAFRYRLMPLLKQLSEKKLIIMATHDIQYVKAYCSHVLLLFSHGEYRFGTCHAMMNKSNLEKLLEIDLPENILL